MGDQRDDIVEADAARQLIAAGDVDGIAHWCTDLPLAQLRRLHAPLDEMRDVVTPGHETRPTSLDKAERLHAEWRRRFDAHQLAMFASSRTAVEAASFMGHCNDPDAVVRVLGDLRPRWLAKLPVRLLDARRPNWMLARAVVRAGLTDEPDHPAYETGIFEGLWPILSGLRADPALIRLVALRYTASPEVGVTGFLSPLPTAPLPHDRYGEGDWNEAIAQLVREGVLSRTSVIERELERLATLPKNRPGSDELLTELALERGERAAHGDAFARLLRSRAGAAVELAQRVCADLLSDGSMRPDTVLEHGDAPFFHGSKSVAVSQVRLLARIGTEPAWTDAAARCLGPALGHPRPDVQQAALHQLAAWWRRLEEDARRTLHGQAGGLAASHVDAWRSLVGTSAAAVLPATGPAWQPPPVERMPPPLDDDELVIGLARMMERTATPALVDRVIEAALLVAGRSAPERLRVVDPLLGRVGTTGSARGQLHAWAGACVRAIAGGEEPPESMYRATLAGMLLDEVLASVHAGVRAGVAREYAALPDVPDGRITRSIGAPSSAPAGVGPVEWLTTRLRADSEHRMFRFDAVSWQGRATRDGPAFETVVRLGAWPDRTGIDGTEHRWEHRWGLDGIETTSLSPRTPRVDDPGHLRLLSLLAPTNWEDEFGTAWTLSLVPHHPELMIVGDEWLGRQLEKEPSITVGTTLRQVLERMARPDQPIGLLGPLTVAIGLGAKPASVRLAAVEALVSVCSSGRSTTAAVATEAVRFVREAGGKLGRYATAVRDLTSISPVHARDLALGLLESLVDARDAPALIAQACDAVAIAGAVPVPESVRAAAVRPGRSLLAIEAQRLVELCTTDPVRCRDA